jgi:hypothetical protein
MTLAEPNIAADLRRITVVREIARKGAVMGTRSIQQTGCAGKIMMIFLVLPNSDSAARNTESQYSCLPRVIY